MALAAYPPDQRSAFVMHAGQHGAAIDRVELADCAMIACGR